MSPNLSKSAQLKIILISIAVVFTISWWIKVYPKMYQSPFMSSFNPLQDLLRHHIIETGEIQMNINAKTRFSAWPETWDYDYLSILLAVLSIVIGPDGLINNLLKYRYLPLPGLILFPSLAAAWYSRLAKGKYRGVVSYDLLLLVSFASFPFVIFTLKFSQGWRPYIYSSYLFALSILLLARASDRRFYILFLTVIFILFNSYHTIAIATLLIIAGIGILISLFSYINVGRSGNINVILVVIVGILFFLIGTYLNGRLNELLHYPVVLISRIDFGAGEFIFRSTSVSGTSTSEFNESLDSIFSLRKISKLISRSMGALIVFGFSSHYLYRIFKSNDLKFLERSELIVLTSLPVLVIYFVLMFLYGGFGQAIPRTINIGIFFLIPILAIIFTSKKFRFDNIIRLFVVIIVITSIVGVTDTKTWGNPDITVQEEKAIIFSGEKIPQNKYIYSDTRLGPNLYYYGHSGMSWASLQQLRNGNAAPIYSCDGEIRGSIRRSIRQEQVVNSDIDRYYFLYSERMRSIGARIWYVNMPVCDYYSKKLTRNKFGKIYSSGDGEVFLS